MEETIQFFYGFIREFRVNIDHAIPARPLRMCLMTASPVISNNIEAVINQLIDRGILRTEDNVLFLTEEGFREIYNQ